ncbi:hypothetical protein DES53_101634 [Roseimicrobium gellanilyticum]|uniref:Uncharacterized protein n=1 Tax=Roseimicrobium gellanilyticum TaxID=748857 RepID=A0A366HW75_9BACT|nr:hypothetical protein [Roseimicrobium gellanilyticum]RBP47834.1 hypothetical protein DES53_101634 [Roseimicrobium gellanilyticum]
MSVPASHVPQVLKLRLTRETPFASQLGCTFLIALILGAVAALGIAAGITSEDDKGKNTWVPYVVGGAFGFFGLLVLWSGIRQLATRGIKETIVEISGNALHLGQSATVAFLQQGPATISSLRANILCVETTSRMVSVPGSKTGPRREQRERYLVQENIFEASYLRVAHGDVWQETREFTVPSEGKPTQGEDTDDYYVRWRIEVWGRAGLIGSFMHPFPVKVVV